MARPEPYSPPLDRLLTLGPPEVLEEPNPESWADPAEHDLQVVHVPELVRMACDQQLHHLRKTGKTEGWGSVHAWRALARLGSTEAAEPLLETLDRLTERASEPLEAALLEEMVYVLAILGQPALEPLKDFVHDATRQGRARVSASGAIALLGRLHPDQAPSAARILITLLEKAKFHTPAFNSFLIADLVDLQAQEALPVIEKAYAQGMVERGAIGSLEMARAKILEKA